jgi:hypothetical protein
MKYTRLGWSAYQVAESFSVMTALKGYRINHPLYDLYEDGWLDVYENYAWDGATGWFDVKRILKASCVHDILCEIIRSGAIPVNNCLVAQALADQTFSMIAQKENLPKWEQVATYLAVRWYQMRKKHPIPPKKIYST